MERWICCHKCGHSGPSATFYHGRGRDVGEHPEHRYCPACRASITWHGARLVPAAREPDGAHLGRLPGELQVAARGAA